MHPCSCCGSPLLDQAAPCPHCAAPATGRAALKTAAAATLLGLSLVACSGDKAIEDLYGVPATDTAETGDDTGETGDEAR